MGCIVLKKHRKRILENKWNIKLSVKKYRRETIKN